MTKPLSPIQTQILAAAAQHSDRLAAPPGGLPTAARNAVVKSMLRAGLLEEVKGDEGTSLWITEAELATVGPPDAAEAADEATVGAEEGREGQRARSPHRCTRTRPLSPLQCPSPASRCGTSPQPCWRPGRSAWSVRRFRPYSEP